MSFFHTIAHIGGPYDVKDILDLTRFLGFALTIYHAQNRLNQKKTDRSNH